MKNITLKYILPIVMFLPSLVSAETVAYEGFNYTPGEALGISQHGGIGWSEDFPGYYASATLNTVETKALVQEGSLEHPALSGDFAASGHSVLFSDDVFLARALNQAVNLEATDSPLYFSFLIQMNEPKRVFMHLGENRVLNSLYFGIDSNMKLRGFVHGGSITYGLQTLRKERVYLLVGKVESSSEGEIKLSAASFSNVPTSEPEFWDLVTSSTATDGRFDGIEGFKIQSIEGASALIDEIRFGDSFDSVVPVSEI